MVGYRTEDGAYFGCFVTLLVLLLANSASALDNFSVVLTSAPFDVTCDAKMKERTYSFRTNNTYADAVRLQNGRFSDGEEETTLDREERTHLGPNDVVFVTLFTSHLRGSGSRTTLYVIICDKPKSSIVLEAASEGLEYSFSSSGKLSLEYPVWRAEDGHAAPSEKKKAVFVWDSVKERFQWGSQ